MLNILISLLFILFGCTKEIDVTPFLGVRVDPRIGESVNKHSQDLERLNLDEGERRAFSIVWGGYSFPFDAYQSRVTGNTLLTYNDTVFSIVVTEDSKVEYQEIGDLKIGMSKSEIEVDLGTRAGSSLAPLRNLYLGFTDRDKVSSIFAYNQRLAGVACPEIEQGQAPLVQISKEALFSSYSENSRKSITLTMVCMHSIPEGIRLDLCIGASKFGAYSQLLPNPDFCGAVELSPNGEILRVRKPFHMPQTKEWKPLPSTLEK